MEAFDVTLFGTIVEMLGRPDCILERIKARAEFDSSWDTSASRISLSSKKASLLAEMRMIATSLWRPLDDGDCCGLGEVGADWWSEVTADATFMNETYMYK